MVRACFKRQEEARCSVRFTLFPPWKILWSLCEPQRGSSTLKFLSTKLLYTNVFRMFGKHPWVTNSALATFPEQWKVRYGLFPFAFDCKSLSIEKILGPVLCNLLCWYYRRANILSLPASSLSLRSSLLTLLSSLQSRANSSASTKELYLHFPCNTFLLSTTFEGLVSTSQAF